MEGCTQELNLCLLNYYKYFYLNLPPFIHLVTLVSFSGCLSSGVPGLWMTENARYKKESLMEEHRARCDL